MYEYTIADLSDHRCDRLCDHTDLFSEPKEAAYQILSGMDSGSDHDAYCGIVPWTGCAAGSHDRDQHTFQFYFCDVWSVSAADRIYLDRNRVPDECADFQAGADTGTSGEKSA